MIIPEHFRIKTKSNKYLLVATLMQWTLLLHCMHGDLYILYNAGQVKMFYFRFVLFIISIRWSLFLNFYFMHKFCVQKPDMCVRSRISCYLATTKHFLKVGHTKLVSYIKWKMLQIATKQKQKIFELDLIVCYGVV